MSEEQEIHGVSQTGSKRGKNQSPMISSPDCRYCGLRHGRGRGKCLAFGKTCMSCGKKSFCLRVSKIWKFPCYECHRKYTMSKRHMKTAMTKVMMNNKS